LGQTRNPRRGREARQRAPLLAATNVRPGEDRTTMRTSTDRMLTTHAGSLPRPADLIELNARRNAGEDVDEAAYQARLREATVEVVQRQVDLGIDVPGDGEFGKAMGEKVNYGAWWFYSFSRLSGLGSSVVDRDK